MHYRRSKKILSYIFLFLIIGTLNNKNLNKLNFPTINEINISGLDKQNIIQLEQKLNFLSINNLFSLNKIKINDVINSNNLVENYSVVKKYPSSIKIKIKKTQFLAYVRYDNKMYYLGSNGKLIYTKQTNQNLPLIFGEFKNNDFLELKKIFDEISFDYKDIKNLFFFKSGRWDIETSSGILIKLPNQNFKESLQLAIQILKENQFQNIREIDLRQKNQVIINE